MPFKLIGSADSLTSDKDTAANYIVMDRFQATETGIVTEFRLRSSTTCNICFAVYADSAGSPGSLLAEDHTSHSATEGWNTYPWIPGLTISSGTYYWLAGNGDQTYWVTSTAGGNGLYKGNTFHDAFPNPAGAGWSTWIFNDGYQIWGRKAGGGQVLIMG